VLGSILFTLKVGVDVLSGFVLESPAVKEGILSIRYTCWGLGLSPPLRWRNPPPDTESFGIVLKKDNKIFWIVGNVPRCVREVKESSKGIIFTPYTNDFGEKAYTPPCEEGPYSLTLYALPFQELPEEIEGREALHTFERFKLKSISLWFSVRK